MDKFNEDQAACEAIENAPDITPGVLETMNLDAEESATEAVAQAVPLAPTGDAQRNARLSTACIKGVMKVFGVDIDTDQISATEELSAEGFNGFDALQPPKWLKLTILGGLLAGTFAPAFFAIRNSIKEVKNANEH